MITDVVLRVKLDQERWQQARNGVCERFFFFKCSAIFEAVSIVLLLLNGCDIGVLSPTHIQYLLTLSYFIGNSA